MFEYQAEPWEKIEVVYGVPDVRVVINGTEPLCNVMVMIGFMHENQHTRIETWRYIDVLPNNYPKRVEARQAGLTWLVRRIQREPSFG